MAKKKKVVDVAKLTDWKGFYDELSKETKRGSAIVGAEFLSQHLAR